jgi:DnaK suppressor protein
MTSVPLSEEQLRHFEHCLLNEQAEMLGVAGLVEDSAETVNLDQTAIGRLSRMDAMQQQAMAVASQQRQSERLLMIKSALERIDDGEYGECLECLISIPIGRLEIDPSAEYCINCAN